MASTSARRRFHHPLRAWTRATRMPGAFNTCPEGFHCDPDGKCDAECLQGSAGSADCGAGFMCTERRQLRRQRRVQRHRVSGRFVQHARPEPDDDHRHRVRAERHAAALRRDGLRARRLARRAPGRRAVLALQQTRFPAIRSCTTTTDETGNFTLAGVPSGSNIPVVITIGKWRRQIVVPTISDCTSTAVGAADTTLPKSMSDMTPNTKSVDMPKIAISTGSADALECLIRKLGIADTEIGTAGGTQHIQLYADTMAGAGEGAANFMSGFAGGTGNFADSQSLWNTTAALAAVRHRHPVVRRRSVRQHQDASRADRAGELLGDRRPRVHVALAQHLDRGRDTARRRRAGQCRLEEHRDVEQRRRLRSATTRSTKPTIRKASRSRRGCST